MHTHPSDGQWRKTGLAAALSIVTMPLTAIWFLLIGGLMLAASAAVAAVNRMLTRYADRVAGALLLVSVLTPTYFAWALNVPALVVGVALLVAPPAIVAEPCYA